MPTYLPMIKFNWSIRHRKRLIPITPILPWTLQGTATSYRNVRRLYKGNGIWRYLKNLEE